MGFNFLFANMYLIFFFWVWVGVMKDELIWNAFARLGRRDHKNGRLITSKMRMTDARLCCTNREARVVWQVASGKCLNQNYIHMWAMKNNKKWVANKSFRAESLPHPSHTCLLWYNSHLPHFPTSLSFFFFFNGFWPFCRTRYCATCISRTWP